MDFTANEIENIKRIAVAGFHMLNNGNDYAMVEILYEGEEENWYENIKMVWYVEYGKNFKKEYIGNDIAWFECNQFKVLKDGEFVGKDDECWFKKDKDIEIFDSEDSEEEEL